MPDGIPEVHSKGIPIGPSNATEQTRTLPRMRFWPFIARRGWQLFALVLFFWALDLALSGWRGWNSFAIVLAVALLVGPMAAFVSYVTTTRNRKLRVCFAGLFGASLGLLLRGAIAPNWPAWGQISCIVGLAVGMAISEMPALQNKSGQAPDSTR